MIFEDRLTDHARASEAYLAERLAPDAGGERGGCANATPERLYQAMRHATLGGGKRFRPFLVIETAALFGVNRAAALPTAAALECIHCYSLAHDDLPAMDNDRLRRGQPTVWAAFDEWTAILAGDALLTLAFEIIADPATHRDPAVTRELTLALARASGRAGMVGGQVFDLMADKLGEPATPDLAHIERLQAMKTGRLIAFACEAGAILGCATHTQRQQLAAFGARVGLIFQLADDLLDATGDTDVVGKATGKDTDAGKATQVARLGVDMARARLLATVDEAHRDLNAFGKAADMLHDAVDFAAHRVR